MSHTVTVQPATSVVIGVGDVVALGGIDEALGVFFSDAVVRAAGAGGCSVRMVREWVEAELISVSGFRMQVAHGPAGGVDGGEGVVRALEDAHVIRCDVRGGARWFELAHDRLVGPVLASNEAWRAEHLAGWQRDALVWARGGRPAGLLLSGTALAAARASAGELSSVDDEFLAASSEAERELQSVRRNRRRLRQVATAAAVLAVLAAATGFVALNAARSGNLLADEITAAEVSRDLAHEETVAATNAAEAARIAEEEAKADTNDVSNELEAARQAVSDAEVAIQNVIQRKDAAELETTDALAAADLARMATAAAEIETWTATDEAATAERAAATTRTATSAIDRQRRTIEAQIATLRRCTVDLTEELLALNEEARNRDQAIAGFLAKPTFEQMTESIRRFLTPTALAATC